MGLTYQDRVVKWCKEAFGEQDMLDTRMRALRFLEESLELVQATGLTFEEAQRVLSYVYSRPKGEVQQEVGGVMVTLPTLVESLGLHMYSCGENALVDCWRRIEIIRKRHAAKPKFDGSEDTRAKPRRYALAGDGEMVEHPTGDWVYFEESPKPEEDLKPPGPVHQPKEPFDTEQFLNAPRCDCGAPLIMQSEKESGHCSECVRIRS